MKTRGQIEAALTEAFTRFERDHLGRGPRSARSFLMQDMVVVRLAGILSPAELLLCQEPGGIDLLKQIRRRLIESCGAQLSALVREATGAEVVSMHTDISARTGERVFLFALDRSLEALFEASGPGNRPEGAG